MKLHWNCKDKTGLRFGRLVVVSMCEKRSASGKIYWNCVCDCGKEKRTMSCSLSLKKTQSCGCLHSDVTISLNKNRSTHGETAGEKTPEYTTWASMMQRCENSGNAGFKNYGGRGIRVCKRWRKYENFLKDMGRKPNPESSIDRIDNDGDYDPSNCRWASKKEQQNNTRRNRKITHNGESFNMFQWADRIGMNKKTLSTRIFRGWSENRALTEGVNL